MKGKMSVLKIPKITIILLLFCYSEAHLLHQSNPPCHHIPSFGGCTPAPHSEMC
ncbi:Uncharacterized protein APZ42_009523 [Daphnia magna]|uniref:Uncharacterized protein n=1 Tax=Daphnia magna TaxID=35525 RepID=A0A162CYP3_9CRUS|nr:Uncharacterized protein APZ42_009523 [Daphnia magna]